MSRVVARTTVDGEGLAAFLAPRHDLLLERAAGDGRFEAVEGPVTGYARAVDVQPAGDRYLVTQTVEFRLAVPYFAWLVLVPFRRAMARPGRPRAPWWAPPARLDARAASVLGTLALLTVAFGYLNTLFTQTAPFLGAEFGAGNRALGVAGSVVRLGGLVALAVVARADRRGRRSVLMFAAAAGCVLSLTGAVAPSLPWLVASQTLARAFATAILVLVAILAAEEMPAGARAYSVSLLAMAGGLGAGICVLALRLADVGTRGWRLLYVLPVLALPVVAAVGRRLPESRRFLAAHPATGLRGHGGRLALLAVSGLLANLFVAPHSQFSNQFLRNERGYSGGLIGLLSVVTGTPGGIGIVVGGRLADVHGRRAVAAVALVAGTVVTTSFYFAARWPMWLLALVGTTISDASIPALGVYGPELFPTGLRGLANGVVAVASLAGSAAGLVAVGVMADRFGRIGPAMAVAAAGPVVLAALVLAAYPETAGRELEDINPEDGRPPPATT